MELRKYWEIILRRKWIVIASFLIILITAVIGANVATPLYEGRSKVLIQSSDDGMSTLMASLNIPDTQQKSTSQTPTYDTEIALAQVKPVLGKLIAELNLEKRNGDKMTADKIIFSPVTLLFPRPYIDVDQYQQSDMLQITGGSTNREEAANIANKLAELYISYTLERRRESFKIARTYIQDKIKDIKKEYDDSLAKKKAFMIQEGTVDIDVETKNLLTYIEQLKTDYKANEIAIFQAVESIALIEKKLAGKEYASSNLISSMEGKLNDLLVEVAGKRSELTEEHPDVLQINKEVEVLRGLLKEKLEVAFGENDISMAPVYDELVKNLKDAYISKRIGEIKRELLNKFLNKSQTELLKIPNKNMVLTALDLSITANQSIYKELLEFLSQVNVAESMTVSKIRLVEPAQAPDSKAMYFPKKTLIYIVGIFLGLFWGVFIAFLIDYMDQTIRDYKDLKDYRFTFLGSIPEFKKGKHLISMTDPNDPLYESYRKVLSSAQFASLDHPYKKLLISGINPKEGSATAAANMGIILAREGKKVLLVDADFRRPKLHELFDLQNTEGLADLLLENTEIEKAILASGIDGLDVLPAGSAPSDSGLLIKSNKMKDVVGKLEAIYDILLFHSAPLLLKNDAVLLMKNLDDMIILLRSKKTTRDDMSRTDELLKNANIPAIGVVINCV
ncbi:MAG: polysaccharide biosynthesis tyrosine autokinase [bacterium]